MARLSEDPGGSDDMPPDDDANGEEPARDSQQATEPSSTQDSGMDRLRRAIGSRIPGGGGGGQQEPTDTGGTDQGSDDPFQDAKDDTRETVASGGSGNGSSGGGNGGSDDPFQGVKDDTRKKVATGGSSPPPDGEQGPPRPETPTSTPRPPKEREPERPSAPAGFDSDGLENTGDGPLGEQATDLEEEFLRKNPEFTAGDVKIVPTDDGKIRTEVSEQAQLGVAMDSITEQFDEEFQNTNLDTGDVEVFKTEDGGFSGTLTESGIGKVEAAAKERVDTGLEGLGFEGTKETGYRAPDAAGVETFQEQQRDIAKTGIGIEGVDTGLETAPTSGEGTFREQQFEEGLRGIGFEGTADDGLRAPDAAGEETFQEQQPQAGKVTPGGAIVASPAALDNEAPGLETREAGSQGQVERAGDLNLERVIDPLGLLFPEPGDKVEQSFDTIQGGLDRAGEEVGLLGAGLARISIDDGDDTGELSNELDPDALEHAFQEEGVGGIVDYVQDIGQQKIDEPNKRGESAAALTRLPLDLAGGILSFTRLGIEGVEAGAYIAEEAAAGRGRESLDTVADVGIEGTQQAVAGIKGAPYVTGIQVLGSLGMSSAAFKAASRAGPRASAVTRYTIQPGEEILGKVGSKVTPAPLNSKLFPDGEPVIFSEETAMRAGKRLHGGAVNKVRTTRDVLRGDRALDPTPTQRELIERFRPAGGEGTLTQEIETGEIENEYAPIESDVAGAQSEPLGGGGTGPLLTTEAVAGSGIETTEPGRTGSNDPVEVTTGGSGELPLLEEIQDAGGVRPFIRGEDLPARIPRTELGFLEDERGSARMLGRSRQKPLSETTDLTEFEEYDLFEDTLTGRQQAFGEFEGEFDPIGETSGSRMRRRRAEQTEADTTDVRIGRTELFSGVESDLDLFPQVEPVGSGVFEGTTPGDRTDTGHRNRLDTLFDTDSRLDTRLDLERFSESEREVGRLENAFEREQESEREQEQETEIEADLDAFGPSKSKKSRKKRGLDAAVSKVFTNPSIAPGEALDFDPVTGLDGVEADMGDLDGLGV